MTRRAVRASAIVVRDNKILLIHRKKEGREYWVFPGGGIEEGEKGEEAVLRELEEETGLKGKLIKLTFFDVNFGANHPFYLVEVNSSKVKLGGSELERNSENDWYNPEWVSLSKLSNLNLLPESAKIKSASLLRLLSSFS